MWPLCAALASPQHGDELPKKDPGGSHMAFANLVSEVTQCPFHCILFEEQSQRAFGFKGGPQTPPLNTRHVREFAEMF